jgi:hypothetical protein
MSCGSFKYVVCVIQTVVWVIQTYRLGIYAHIYEFKKKFIMDLKLCIKMSWILW